MSDTREQGVAARPTWVLLRGLTRETRHWNGFDRKLAADLQRQGTGAASVLCLDLPGNGTLHGVRSPASVPAIAAQCRAALLQRGIAPPYVLLAMSLGGMAALHWCQRAPQEVAGCVLINTSLRGRSPFWQRLRPRNYPQLARLLFSGGDLLQQESAVLGMTSNDPQHWVELPARWAAIAREHPVSRANALRQLLAAARYAPTSWRPLPPMLVLASEGDRFVSAQCSKRLAAHWNLPLRLHPRAGHDLPLDDPQWVLRQLREWQNGLAAPTGG